MLTIDIKIYCDLTIYVRSYRIVLILLSCMLKVIFYYTGATYIKKMLMKNKSLKYLSISHNKIGDDGVRHVTEGLQQNDSLVELRLYDCEISGKGR